MSVIELSNRKNEEETRQTIHRNSHVWAFVHDPYVEKIIKTRQRNIIIVQCLVCWRGILSKHVDDHFIQIIVEECIFAILVYLPSSSVLEGADVIGNIVNAVVDHDPLGIGVILQVREAMRQHSPLVLAHVIGEASESDDVGVALQIHELIDLVEPIARDTALDLLLGVEASLGELGGGAAGEQLRRIAADVIPDGGRPPGMNVRVFLHVVDRAEDDGPVFGLVSGLDLVLALLHYFGRNLRDDESEYNISSPIRDPAKKKMARTPDSPR